MGPKGPYKGVTPNKQRSRFNRTRGGSWLGGREERLDKNYRGKKLDLDAARVLVNGEESTNFPR